MSPQTPGSHLTHDELSGTEEMSHDCREVSVNLRLERAVRAAVSVPPSIHFDDYPAEVGKREIRVSDAAARLADALHLRG